MLNTSCIFSSLRLVALVAVLPFTRGIAGTTARGEATELELHCDIGVMLLMVLLLLLLDGDGTDDGEAHDDDDDDDDDA